MVLEPLDAVKRFGRKRDRSQYALAVANLADAEDRFARAGHLHGLSHLTSRLAWNTARSKPLLELEPREGGAFFLTIGVAVVAGGYGLVGVSENPLHRKACHAPLGHPGRRGPAEIVKAPV